MSTAPQEDAQALVSDHSTTLAWPDVPQPLAAIRSLPRDPRYAALSSTYMRSGRPAVVFSARDDEDVSAVVTYAAEVRRLTGGRVPLSIRSGGHGISGAATNTGGIVLDLSGLNRIAAGDAEDGLFLAQAGATWGAVARALAPCDRALTSGNFGGTGVGGLVTAGGIGFFARSQGLTLDNVTRLRVVTADGSARWVDQRHEPDLFWALRGGATQGGIVVDAELHAPRLGSIGGGATVIHHEVQYLVDDLPGFVNDWGAWVRESPRELESFLMLQPAGDRRTVVQARHLWANDRIDEAQPTLEAGLNIARVLEQRAIATPYARLVPPPGRTSTRPPLEMRSALVDRSDARLGMAIRDALTHEATLLVELRALGGAVSDVAVPETAWAGRHQEAFVATWAHPFGEASVRASFSSVDELATGSYGAYSTDTTAAAANRVWPGVTGDRLRAVSDRYDPERLFDQGLVLPR
ncbi:Mitomycin radical oxidase [Leucobacter sp. BZR 635]